VLSEEELMLKKLRDKELFKKLPMKEHHYSLKLLQLNRLN
jgi:hypothetical protein